jgi:hypothetical protein
LLPIEYDHLLTQQTVPKEQEPLGRPPNKVQILDLVQIPASELGVVQLSNWFKMLLKFGFGMNGGFFLFDNELNGFVGWFPVLVLPN